MEQRNKTKKEQLIQKQFQTLLKSNAERMARTEKFVNSFQKGLSGVLELSHDQSEYAKQKLLNYLNTIAEKVEQLPLKEGLAFLQAEKKKLKAQLILANINKDGYDRKYFESALKDIIEPLIEIQIECIETNVNSVEPEGNNPDHKIEEKKITVKKDIPIKPLPDGFKQIECSGTQDEIMTFFMRLFTSINESNNRPYMTEENVIKLVHRNFKIFESEPFGGYIPLNLTQRQKGRLRYFIYDFYSQFGGSKSKAKLQYIDFLIWNFELFKDDNRDNLNKSVNASSKPKNDLI